MEHIRTARDGGVGVITIDRRERFNALDVMTAHDLRQAARAMARDGAVRCVVLRGTGGVFCSGADLKYIRAGGDDASLGYLHPDTRGVPRGYGEIFKHILAYLHGTISEIRRAHKPFIAAVDGAAAAGGFGLAMCCDLVVASRRSTFEYAYFKTALTGAESTTFFLPKLIGARRASDLAFLGRKLTADEAQSWGLVSEVYDDDRFDGDVAELARRLAVGPTASYAAAKTLMNEAAGVERLDSHLDRELDMLVRAADGADFAEGITAFFAKRLPQRPGRRLVGAVLVGTLLNPLNSSMIAVALGLIQADFRVSMATVSWLLSGFALAAAVAQPMMGRFADLFGPRRIFCAGLLVVGIASALAPLVPAFGWLIACRMLQAALYEHAPAQHMGAASGQFQTFRYVGAILSTSLLGLAFGTTVTSHGLHLLAYALAGISSLLLVASLTTRRQRRIGGG
jgi:2-(1,2-epoxy-1,2-dihydrophenyl)acetyl-CoA isomerase